MKKILLLSIIALLSSALNAQVTQIVANKGLESTGSIPFDNNKVMLMSKLDSTAWVTDGTSGGSFQLSSSIKYDGNSSGLLNGKVIFSGNTPSTAQELFITDGTVVGTVLLKDINPGTNSSSPDNFVLMNGILYFTAFTVAEGRELWRTDGTPNGTILVKDIVPGRASSDTTSNYHLYSTGSYLLLSAPTPSSGMELWKSDGTNNGTALLKDINPGAASSNPDNFNRYSSIVLFQATDSSHGTEIWKTDGTSNGTMLLKDIYPGIKSSNPYLGFSNLAVFNGRYYFSANDSTHGKELWSTDGTTQNTALVKDIEPGSGSGVNFFFSAMPVGNKFFFTASTTANGTELWQSDGTDAGTQLFKDILPGPGSSSAVILPTLLILIRKRSHTDYFREINSSLKHQTVFTDANYGYQMEHLPEQ
jgi:ELWxxDGT repeat protein